MEFAEIAARVKPSNNSYAGIGSRSTPEDILVMMRQLGYYLAAAGYILRSGGADGADTAFEQGVDAYCEIHDVLARKEIYLPWDGFNGRAGICNISPLAYEVGRRFHPTWERLSSSTIQLMARNSCQVLGKNIDSSAKFVICFDDPNDFKGGTKQALRIAKYFKIKVLNLYFFDDRVKAKAIIEKLSQKYGPWT